MSNYEYMPEEKTEHWTTMLLLALAPFILITNIIEKGIEKIDGIGWRLIYEDIL